MNCTAKPVNTVLISGILDSGFEFSHSSPSGTKFLKSTVTVFRPNSMKFDHVPVTVRSDRIIASSYKAGDTVKIEGRLVSFRKKGSSGNPKSHKHSCMIRSIDHYPEDAENLNSVSIVGIVSDNPQSRAIPPRHKMTSFNLRIPKPDKSYDVITVVSWDELCNYADLLLVEDTISANGHLSTFARKNSKPDSDPSLQVIASELAILNDKNND